MNLYASVGGDPVNLTDPDGLKGYKPPPPKCVNQCTGTYPITGSRIPGGGETSTIGVIFGPSAEIRNRTDYYLGNVHIGTTYGPWQSLGGFTQLGFMLAGASTATDASAKAREERLICTGRAYVLAGNPSTVGRTGGFLVPVRAGSAAVIPRQFTGELPAGPVMRAIGKGAFGWTSGMQSFHGFTDTIGHLALGSARQAQSEIMARAPGQFVIELVTGHAEDNSFVTLSLPPATPRCPQGTTPM